MLAVVIIKMNASPRSTPGAAAAGAAGGGGGGAGLNQASDFLKDYMASNPSRPSAGSGGGQSKDSWGLRGKGHKLGSG